MPVFEYEPTSIDTACTGPATAAAASSATLAACRMIEWMLDISFSLPGSADAWRAAIPDGEIVPSASQMSTTVRRFAFADVVRITVTIRGNDNAPRAASAVVT